MRLVVTGGGSGGHIYPALSVAAALREIVGERLGPDDLLYVGMTQRMEYDLARRAGLPFHGVNAGEVRGRTPPRLALSGAKIGAGIAQAMALLARFRAQAVLATGGYVCVPVVLAAWTLRIPTLVYLPDVEPGLAVRFLCRFARRIAVSVEASRKYLPAHKVVVTGYPVRPELFRIGNVSARQHFGLDPEGKVLLVLGGSQGAHSINDAVRSALPELLGVCQIIQVSGGDDEAALRAAREDLPDGMRRRYLLYRYLHEDMAYALAAADLAVSRSGASVLGEYPAVGLPSVLVPYPFAGMHQRHNARVLTDASAAVTLEDRALDSLYPRVRRLLEDAETLQAMSAQARSLARPEAARLIAGMLLEMAGEAVPVRSAEPPARPDPVEGRAADRTEPDAVGQGPQSTQSWSHPDGGVPVESSQPDRKPHVHVVAIGGIGLSGLARILLADGYPVSGCDLKLWSITDRLAELGATVYQGHSPDHLNGVDWVVTTRAVSPETPELLEAGRRRIPVLRRGELLGRLMEGRTGIGVAGTHGKTTTTSMVALLLEQAGLDPTVLVGGEVINLDTNAKRGAGPYVVVEADEFDRTFLQLKPRIAVVTNIEPEHLDYYGDFRQEVEAFEQYLGLLPADGVAVVCIDDPILRALVGQEPHPELPRLHRENLAVRQIASYSVEGPAHWSAQRLRPNSRGGTDFSVTRAGQPFGEFSLAVPGRHNVSNALAAVAVAHALGLQPEGMRETLATFQGVRRRFEIRAEARGITVVDDYAHHPTEVRATLRAARDRYPGRRIVALFQPHTYSRVRTLLPDFVRAFYDSDVLLITSIYAAREQNTWGITGSDLVDAVQHPNKRYVETLAQAAELIGPELRPGDVFLTLGAGDVYEVAELVARQIRED